MLDLQFLFLFFRIVLFALLIPLVGIIGLHYSIGGDPKGLTLGIVDEEIRSYKDCMNMSLQTFVKDNHDCHLHKISCRFIKEIDDDVAVKVGQAKKVCKQKKTSAIYFRS